MLKLLFLSSILMLACAPLRAQESARNYLIHLSDGPFQFQNDLQTNWIRLKTDQQAFVEGRVYSLIQFNTIPTNTDKAAISNQGIELISYIPNYAWIAKLDTSIQASMLANLNIRNIAKVSSLWKMSSELSSGIIPDYAGTKENVKAKILFWKEQTNFDLLAILNDYNVSIQEVNIQNSWVEMEASWDDLINLSRQPRVQFIEFASPPIENEGILDEAERIISTYISDNPGKNYYFDGSGVIIAVEEGGNIDSLQNPNFRNRLDRNNEVGTSISGHKTGVALRMGGAGNINPKERGTAFGAEVHSGGFDFATAAANDVTIINRSVGWGCPSGTETYNSSSESYDNLVRTNPTFMITHSAGNAGGSNCYAGAASWGNITGMPKMAKNIFVVGSSGNDGALTGFSSRGPAKDGRILPNIIAPGGGGTSHASPNLAGVYGQLNQAYRFHNGGLLPNSGLLKAIIMNTADDMLNPGPDFKTGFGSVNARRGYEVIRQNQFLSSSVAQGINNMHSISVPANVRKLKVLVYWVDWEATPGITTRSIVNDIDIVLQDPTGSNYQPWVLNPAFDVATLDNPAVRATDSLNNVEQVTINDPSAGTYFLMVSGTMIPQGPQEYFVTYEFVMDDIVLTHPHGGEKFVPNEIERIRWDACDSNLNFNLSYSLDNGSSWNPIASGLSPDSRYFDWTVPSVITNQARVKVERGATLGISDTTFSILGQPTGLEHIWTCADSSLFKWDAFPNADGYVVYRVVGDYMDSVAFTTTNTIILNGLSITESEYISIAAFVNGVTSRRVIALERVPSDVNCDYYNLGSVAIISPGVNVLPSCMAGTNSEIVLHVQNWGVNSVDSIPVVYSLNGGIPALDTIFSVMPSGSDQIFTFSTSPNFIIGTNILNVWTAYPGDLVFSNDTLSTTFEVYPSSSAVLPISENFDSFTNCSTAWDCELVNCALQNGWYNVPNGSGDDIDWRTYENATGSVNTGPTNDHTSGSGKYIYLEGSGPCVNSTARLYSPCIDMTGVNQAAMSFWYHAYGSGIGELHVDAIADGILYENIMTPVVGDQGDQWIYQSVDLSQFSNTQLVVVLRGSTGGNYFSDLALDDINIQLSPVVDFTSPQTQLCEFEIITFDNTTTNADTYEWSFSPNTVTYFSGTNANSFEPTVSFNNPGAYTVQQIATNTSSADTLVLVDHIYVWDNDVTITAATDYCVSDSVIVFADNNGQPVDYYLNGVIQMTSTNSSYYYPTASDGDTIYLAYNVNSNCTLISDSIVITVTNVNNGITQSGLVLNASAMNAMYQWIDCGNNNTIIPGANNQSYAPMSDGEYAVIIIENGCADTSDCLVFSTNSLDQLKGLTLNYYPNPTSGQLTIELGQSVAKVEVVVRTVLGQIVSQTSFENESELSIEIQGEPAVYFVDLLIRDQKQTIRVVKKN